MSKISYIVYHYEGGDSLVSGNLFFKLDKGDPDRGKVLRRWVKRLSITMREEIRGAILDIARSPTFEELITTQTGRDYLAYNSVKEFPPVPSPKLITFAIRALIGFDSTNVYIEMDSEENYVSIVPTYSPSVVACTCGEETDSDVNSTVDGYLTCEEYNFISVPLDEYNSSSDYSITQEEPNEEMLEALRLCESVSQASTLLAESIPEEPEDNSGTKESIFSRGKRLGNTYAKKLRRKTKKDKECVKVYVSPPRISGDAKITTPIMSSRETDTDSQSESVFECYTKGGVDVDNQGTPDKEECWNASDQDEEDKGCDGKTEDIDTALTDESEQETEHEEENKAPVERAKTGEPYKEDSGTNNDEHVEGVKKPRRRSKTKDNKDKKAEQRDKTCIEKEDEDKQEKKKDDGRESDVEKTLKANLGKCKARDEKQKGVRQQSKQLRIGYSKAERECAPNKYGGALGDKNVPKNFLSDAKNISSTKEQPNMKNMHEFLKRLDDPSVVETIVQEEMANSNSPLFGMSENGIYNILDIERAAGTIRDCELSYAQLKKMILTIVCNRMLMKIKAAGTYDTYKYDLGEKVPQKQMEEIRNMVTSAIIAPDAMASSLAEVKKEITEIKNMLISSTPLKMNDYRSLPLEVEETEDDVTTKTEELPSSDFVRMPSDWII